MGQRACRRGRTRSTQQSTNSTPRPPPLPLHTRNKLPEPPRTGLGNWEAAEGGLRNAIDLVRLIKEEHGDYFGVAVAGHPEGHVDGKAAAAAAEGGGGEEEQGALELQRLKEKVGRREVLRFTVRWLGEESVSACVFRLCRRPCRCLPRFFHAVSSFRRQSCASGDGVSSPL